MNRFNLIVHPIITAFNKPPQNSALGLLPAIILAATFPIISIIYRSMSQGSIPEREPQSYEDFAYRFQLAEGLPQDKHGVIFIGNTRAGKSTLALAMSGAAMKVVYDDGALTFLNPSDKAYKDVVRNTQQSVTDRPNFYPSRQGQNRWAIVDMPGHADSSRFRELINFHYIRTMAANLGEVRFLLVVTLQFRNGRFVLPDKEVQMLNSFRIMFPNCSNCVNIIINRVEDAAANAAPASACFRETVASNPNLSHYYGAITNNKIHVVERPAYQVGSSGEERHEAPYCAINKRMQEICNNDSEFLKLSEHNYYSLNIFKAGDHAKNAEFYQRLLKINQRIAEGVAAAAALFKSTLLALLRALVAEGSCRPCESELINIFDIFLGKHSVDTPRKRELQPIAFTGQLLLENTKILQILQVITQERFIVKPETINIEDKRAGLKRAEEYCKDIADNFASKLLHIIQCGFGRGQLLEKAREFYLFLVRRIAESYFIANILLNKENLVGQEKGDIGELFRQFEKFTAINEQFMDSYESLVDSAISFSVPALFRRFSSSQYEQLKEELFDNFNIIEGLGNRPFKDKPKFDTIVLPHIALKKDEINFFVITNSEPASPQQNASYIQKLLKAYSSADLSMKVGLLHKLAKLLENQKEYKHSVVLCLHLSLNGEALRLLALLQPTLKKESVGQLYSEVASGFEENGMFFYAQQCLQTAKRYCTDDLDRFIQYERRILTLNDPTHTSKLLKRRLEAKDKVSYWNWQRINDQVLFLKQKYHIKDQSPTKSVLLRGFR